MPGCKHTFISPRCRKSLYITNPPKPRKNIQALTKMIFFSDILEYCKIFQDYDLVFVQDSCRCLHLNQWSSSLVAPSNIPINFENCPLNFLLKPSICYKWYSFFNRLSTFSWVHLILLQHVIILSQGMLSLIYFLMRSMISLMLSQPSFNFHAVHGYVFFSSILIPHTSHMFMLPFYVQPGLLNFHIHSPGLRVLLMHTVLVDLIQSYTNTMSSI